MRVNPDLRREIVRFGGGGVDACMNCGNCTAECPLSGEDTVFPRKVIRYLQVGLEEKLRSAPEPWLCYYCGECSDSCPRQADPGETMMAARRWLTSQYDFTGISRRIYSSKLWEAGACVAAGLVVVLLFVLFGGPIVTSRVDLLSFAPVRSVELADWTVAAVMSFFLLTNAWRMHGFILGETKARPSHYISEGATFFLHLLTQKRWLKCSGKSIHWLKHFLLATAYVTMFVLVFVFLPWFETEGWNGSSLLGYSATAVLLYVTADGMLGRLRKRERFHEHSHHTDWTFLILLFLIALTGILVHVFRMAGLPRPTYYTYVIHLAVDAPWLVLIVPFGKWAHLLYRPLATYFVAVRRRAEASARAAAPATS